ncbi:MAG TPA: ATP-binding protein [Burkholderiales bacterium]|jgi:two-component system sensor histidine kinase GlrK|nr:ATP-binding protein [Burkholderiales bacterium]
MQLYYPRSFLKLILAGFSLAVLPLIFALINNAFSIHQLATHSQRVVYQAVQATQNSRFLIEQITNMERSVRQFAIIGEPSLLQGYGLAHERFVDTGRRMATLPLDARQKQALEVLRAREAALFERIGQSGAKAEVIGSAVAELAALAEAARALDEQGNLLVDREVDTMQKMAGEVQRFIYWQLLALVPIALLLVVAATLLISKPIAQLESAIQNLGEGRFDARVAVNGPADLESLGRQLDWLRLRLLDLEEQKSRFLRHVSHELKTPLTALREGVELLSDEVTGKMTAGQFEIARILRQNTLRLQKLIEDLLNYHSAQFHTSALTFSQFDLKAMVTRVAQQHSLTMRSKNLSLNLSASDLHIEADENKIEAIIDNLLSNAIKFSPTGGTIRVQLRRRGSDAVIDVMDEGPGISPEERGRVFEPFYQGNTAYTGPVKGTGLGLAIVREYATAHQGSAEIIDDGNPGAHLRVVLPTRQMEAAA